MPRLDEILTPRRTTDGNYNETVSYEAVVATDPADVSEEIKVTIDGIDGGDNEYGPCPWMPRVDDAGATVLPSIGDRALVLQSDDGDFWVVAWWPS